MIVGNRIRLRAMTVKDAPAMFAALDDPDTMRLTGTHGTYSLAQVTAHLDRCEQASDRVDFAIMVADAVIGEVVLNDIDTDNRSANFRIALWYSHDRDRGYGSEATALMLEYGFGTLGLNRIELEVYAFNPRARHVYERAGFVYEGTRRQALRWDGEWIDAHCMAILHEDYRQD